jgi:hypothetical protein
MEWLDPSDTSGGERLTAALATLDFTPLETDHAVFKFVQDDHIIILAVHVDDCVITGSSPSLILDTEDRIAKLFKVTFLGPISWLFGLEIIRDRANRSISIIDSVLQRFNMEACKPAAVPMDTNIQLTRDQCPTDPQEIADMQRHSYWALFGSLIWITTASRPDIAYAATVLSRFNDNPGLVYWNAAKRVLQYLKGD